MTELEKRIQKLARLKQNKDRPLEELEVEAKRSLEKEQLKNSFVGLLDEEVDRAVNLYYQYVEEHSFESLAEKSTLINLVYLEILKERVQTFIKKESVEHQGAIPLNMTEKLLELDEQIMSSKEKLRMLKETKEVSALDIFQELKTKALAYYNEHAGETYVKCPYCLQLFRLLMKIDNLEPAQATFFKGTTLYNAEVLNLYHTKKITLEEAAKIHGVHEKYITFIYENLYLKARDDTKD